MMHPIISMYMCKFNSLDDLLVLRHKVIFEDMFQEEEMHRIKWEIEEIKQDASLVTEQGLHLFLICPFTFHSLRL